ncbi:pyruvoyl-dependent arginine decarboxylase [Candidatus Woesearchaeota archaeon]|nr:pyruvoyl-dependent arginine decarboxylase [Candidatus Woesearchaeota archaeon]
MNQKVVNKILLKDASDRKSASRESSRLLIGNKVPREYFVTSGVGESDITIHAGSYHLALKDAGIEMCNIMTYSSIMPGIAQEIAKPDGLVHGSVMDTISAVSNSNKGERATAAIIYSWLYDKETGERYGGLVCEYHGDKTEEEAGDELRMSLSELYVNGFSERFELKETRLISRSIVPEKKFGTALVAICFTSYEYPVVG